MGLLHDIGAALRRVAGERSEWRAETIEGVPSYLLDTELGVFVAQPHEPAELSWHWFLIADHSTDFGLSLPNLESCKAQIRERYKVG